MGNSPQEQESLRDRMYDPVRRWRDLQERIRWAEQKVQRATPSACIANERKILIGLGAAPGSTPADSNSAKSA